MESKKIRVALFNCPEVLYIALNEATKETRDMQISYVQPYGFKYALDELQNNSVKAEVCDVALVWAMRHASPIIELRRTHENIPIVVLTALVNPFWEALARQENCKKILQFEYVSKEDILEAVRQAAVQPEVPV